MRKVWFLALLVVTLAASAWAQSVRVPAAYRGATSQELQASAIDVAKMEAEAHSRKLTYSLVGLVALFGAIFVVGFIYSRRRRIDDALVGTLATVVSAKRSLGKRVEDRIASKEATDE